MQIFKHVKESLLACEKPTEGNMKAAFIFFFLIMKKKKLNTSLGEGFNKKRIIQDAQLPRMTSPVWALLLTMN